MALLEVKDLGIAFGGLRALKDVQITLDSGEIVGLIGPNGAGKTTVFNLLTDVYVPTEGSILLDGTSIVGKRTYEITQNGIARTFQNIRLFKYLSVIDNVKIAMNGQMTYNMFQAAFRTPKYWREERAMDEKAMELLSVFGLEKLAETRAGNLPYGRQKAGDRPCFGHQAEDAAARRAGGGHEPDGNTGASRNDQADQGQV